MLLDSRHHHGIGVRLRPQVLLERCIGDTLVVPKLQPGARIASMSAVVVLCMRSCIRISVPTCWITCVLAELSCCLVDGHFLRYLRMVR